MTSEKKTGKPARYGMTIDVDRCTGCGACMVACAVENNIPPAHEGADDRKGITWIRVFQIDNGEEYPNRRSAFIPVLCQQCGKDAPCASVCPQQAVEVDPATGIVGQMPERCLGCRYCMAACPYHARYFNWWDPAWPAGMEKSLNPDVAPRMRGVVEKCNFCHGRWHAAKQRAAAEGRSLEAVDYVPACVEACPTGAIQFGDLNRPESAPAQAARNGNSFRLLEKIGTEPKIYYRSKKDWVRQISNAPKPTPAHTSGPTAHTPGRSAPTSGTAASTPSPAAHTPGRSAPAPGPAAHTSGRSAPAPGLAAPSLAKEVARG